MNIHRVKVNRRERERMTEETIILDRKKITVYSLSKFLSLDPKIYLGDIAEVDLSSLYSKILKSKSSSNHRGSSESDNEGMQWIKFAGSFPVDPKEFFGALNSLNNELAHNSVLLGNGLRISEVDIVVFSIVHVSVLAISNSDRKKFPHVLRWMDYIQNTSQIAELFDYILVEKTSFEPPADPKTKKIVESTKSANTPKVDLDLKKGTIVTNKKKAAGDGGTAEKKLPEKEASGVDKDKDVSISLLNMQVGVIRKAWKHPSADSLLVEEIDVGDAKLRQVVSGLAMFVNPHELMNRRVVLITNVKHGKLRDVLSEGLVLCASNNDHSIVEPLLPPDGAKIGERVSFDGNEGKPEDVLNPKKKQLDKITPHLFTDDAGIATFKGIPFMTSGGPCTSYITNASIK